MDKYEIDLTSPEISVHKVAAIRRNKDESARAFIELRCIHESYPIQIKTHNIGQTN